MRRLEVTRTMSPPSGGCDRSSFGFSSSSLAPNTDEALSAFSRVAQETDEAIPESSWVTSAKERDCWSIDLQAEMEELDVGCPSRRPKAA